jgi:acetyl esterase/lipase
MKARRPGGGAARLTAALALAACGPGQAGVAKPPPGGRGDRAEAAPARARLLAQAPCAIPEGSYDDYVRFLGSRPPADARDAPFDAEAFRRAYPRDAFEGLRDGQRTECLAITYVSGSAKVHGVVVRPRNAPPGGAPAVLYARGGFGEAGKIRLRSLIEFQRLADRGYAVLATEYRGNHGGSGVDENGGADVDDLTNLSAVAHDVGGIDPAQLYLWGESRGAMMARSALARAMPVRAAVVSGAVTDLAAALRARPELEDLLAVA